MSEPRPLHRLFGLSWSDFLQGSPLTVETELDLSLKQQLLDLVLIRRGPGPLSRPLPDGFDDLATHNLISFKSHQEALDNWALCELIGHYVNYRKQVSPALDDLLPEADFRLLAVCVRHPHNLVQQVTMTARQEGVYELRLGIVTLRVVVVHQLPQAEHNAMLHLFSARKDLLRYGQEHYRPHSRDTSSLLYQLYKAYNEDPAMTDKLKEFVRQTIDELLSTLPPEELRKRLSPEERLEGLSAQERLKGLSPEQLRAIMAAAEEQLRGNGGSGHHCA